jgi:hypothetical protein
MDRSIDEDLSRAIEMLDDRRTLVKFLTIGIAANILLWLLVVLVPQIAEWFVTIFSLNNKLGMLLLGVPFGIGLYVTYAACRIKFPDIENNKNLEGDVMASFNYQAHSTKRWFVWLFATLCGVLNAGLLLGVGLFVAGEL